MENVTVSIAKPKTTPKDFFLWLFAMVALYISVGSFIRLLFQYVDAIFPDPVFYGYDPYSGGMRFAIASLVVFFPLFFFLTSVIQKDLRAHMEKRELGIRKWLIYLTLFIAGMTLAGDLVALLYTFLGGDLTNRFLLKALSIFLVIGSVFWYYFMDLKGYWVDKAAKAKAVGIGIGALIVITIACGFFIIGSPMDQRDLRIDAERVSALQMIQSQIVSGYWQTKGTLPATLDELNDPLQYFTVPTDPETKAPYKYRIEPTPANTFVLCATFSKPTPKSDVAMGRPVEFGGINDNWEHGVGEVCFTRTIDPDKFPVQPKGKVPMVPAPVY